MNWPSFSEPEMFAGQNRSKNKKILLCLHTSGTRIISFFSGVIRKYSHFQVKMSKMLEACHIDEFSLTCTSGHKHVGCMLWNMGGCGRDLVLNPCLCS